MSSAVPAEAAIALSLQRALLGAVTAKLRAVAFRLEHDLIIVTFVFDGPISADDAEAAQIAVTEVISDFPAMDCREELVRVDGPAPLPLPVPGGRLVYARKETLPP